MTTPAGILAAPLAEVEAGQPLPVAKGGTGQTTQQAAMDALAGAQTSGQVLRGNGTHVVLAAIAAGDVPTLNQNTAGTASNITGPLSGVPVPTGSVSLNSQKITSLANGSGAQDAAAFGQIPVADSTAANIKAVGTQAAGSNGKWADSGHVHPPGSAFLCAPAVYAPSASGSAVQLVMNTTTLAAPNVLATTVAAGSNGGQISLVASWASPSGGVLDVATTTGWPASGTVTVAASGATTAIVTYTGIAAGQLTGCAYVSGSPSGTVATGGAVTLTSVTLQTNSFTAPASGAVIVQVWMAAQISASGDKLALALTAAGTVTPVLGTVNTVLLTSSGNVLPLSEAFYVSGLTPGTSYQFALVGAVTSTASVTIFAFGGTSTALGGAGTPVIMTVQGV